MPFIEEEAEEQKSYEWDLTVEVRELATWRRLVTGVVARLGGDEEAGRIAGIGLSELLGNVIKHVQNRACRLVIRAVGAWVYIHLHDTSHRVPAMTTPAWDAESGRGLWLLNSMVGEWGYTCRAEGKDVWFRVPLVNGNQEVSGASRSPHGRGRAPANRPGDSPPLPASRTRHGELGTPVEAHPREREARRTGASGISGSKSSSAAPAIPGEGFSSASDPLFSWDAHEVLDGFLFGNRHVPLPEATCFLANCDSRRPQKSRNRRRVH
ncbi:ATP-binding protein [Streptomyces alkaliphilus]|uniref:ATP-binding protein n=1 Tax=Streptomyces alkaliphilus TaxID=1472722 RepID=UPI0034D20DEF